MSEEELYDRIVPYIAGKIVEYGDVEESYKAAKLEFGLDILIAHFLMDPSELIHGAPVLPYLASDNMPLEAAAKSLVEVVGLQLTYDVLQTAYPLHKVQEVMAGHGLSTVSQKKQVPPFCNF